MKHEVIVPYGTLDDEDCLVTYSEYADGLSFMDIIHTYRCGEYPISCAMNIVNSFGIGKCEDFNLMLDDSMYIEMKTHVFCE